MTPPFTVIETVTDHVNEKFAEVDGEHRLKAICTLVELWFLAEQDIDVKWPSPDGEE